MVLNNGIVIYHYEKNIVYVKVFNSFHYKIYINNENGINRKTWKQTQRGLDARWGCESYVTYAMKSVRETWWECGCAGICE